MNTLFIYYISLYFIFCADIILTFNSILYMHCEVPLNIQKLILRTLWNIECLW